VNRRLSLSIVAVLAAMVFAPAAYAQDGQYQVPEGVSQPISGGSIPAGIQGPCPEGQVTQTGSDGCVPEEDFLTCEEVYGADYCAVPEETATEGQQYAVGEDNIIDVPPGPGRCEGIIEQTRYEACVAQYRPDTGTPAVQAEAPAAAPVAETSTAVPANPAPEASGEASGSAEVLPDTGGVSPLVLGALAFLVPAGLVARRLMR
jgi:hypothetical protein